MDCKPHVFLTDSGAVKTFTIDWNMGNINTGLGDDFKIKMVNEAGLYEEEVFPTDAKEIDFPMTSSATIYNMVESREYIS